jgi:outer membrane protein assembly factor BamB
MLVQNPPAVIRRWFLAILLGALTPACASADWPTYRGNAQRTGSIDDRPGPAKPRVLWHYGGKENYVGSPCIAGNRICVAGLGAFNSGVVHALDTTSSDKRLAWSKAPPLLKLPVVSSPISLGESVLFGDGMHQTDGASLHAVLVDSGRLLWKYELPGKLVHMEGSPTIVGNRVYLGAGNGGLLCLDTARLSLAGKEQTPAEIQKQLAAEWQKLMEAYEKEKKVDPDFAIPPTEDSLPKAAPKLLWQQGASAWHIDAPVAVVRDKVLAASAYLDLEKSGERALICLQASTGDTLWKTPLEQNPWAGATIAGDLAILGTSTIRLEPRDIPRGRGSLVAVNLSDGSPHWKKLLPGGVVSSVAVKGNLVISTATDGVVRANDVATGDLKWTYPAGAAFFAGPAIAGDVVYAGDLKGVVHAIGLADGKEQWKLDLNASATKEAMIYGSPIVHEGKIYVGTCNLSAAGKGQQAIVCIGE